MFSGKDNLIEVAKKSSMDDKGDKAFFDMILPSLDAMAPEDRLKFRLKLTQLVMKYAYPEAYDDFEKKIVNDEVTSKATVAMEHTADNKSNIQVAHNVGQGIQLPTSNMGINPFAHPMAPQMPYNFTAPFQFSSPIEAAAFIQERERLLASQLSTAKQILQMQASTVTSAMMKSEPAPFDSNASAGKTAGEELTLGVGQFQSTNGSTALDKEGEKANNSQRVAQDNVLSASGDTPTVSTVSQPDIKPELTCDSTPLKEQRRQQPIFTLTIPDEQIIVID